MSISPALKRANKLTVNSLKKENKKNGVHKWTPFVQLRTMLLLRYRLVSTLSSGFTKLEIVQEINDFERKVIVLIGLKRVLQILKIASF